VRSYLWLLSRETSVALRANAWWMAWNLFLAVVPVALAIALFHERRRQGLLWWGGVGVFLLFLPNAPYVLTDLVHLRADVRAASLNGTVLLGILPSYAAFVLAGFGCYAVALYEVRRAIARSRWASRQGVIELLVHALSALGVLIGRFPHINSWTVVTHPATAVSTVTPTLLHPAAPVILLVLFFAIWSIHAVLRVTAAAAWQWVDQRWHIGHAALPGAGLPVEPSAPRSSARAYGPF